MFVFPANDLVAFERTLENKQNRILADPFIMSYVAPLRRRMREQVFYALEHYFQYESFSCPQFLCPPLLLRNKVLLSLVKPYHRIRLAFVSKELKLESSEVELLLVDMITEKRIPGKIDQIGGLLILEGEQNAGNSKKYDAISQWTATLQSLSANLTTKVHL